MSIIPSILGGLRSGSVFDPFSLDVWDPFKDISASFPETKEVSGIVNARVDWKETPEAHVFKTDLPGLKKEEVKVEVEEGNVLQISGERSKESEEKNDKWHRMERSSGKFVRRFRLPENVKIEEVKAVMENGVLTVTVPKEEVKKAETKTIEISDTVFYGSSLFPPQHFFVLTAGSDVFQIDDIADMIGHYKWREVAAVYTDDDGGRNGIAALSVKLAEKNRKISFKEALKPQMSRDYINGNVWIASSWLATVLYSDSPLLTEALKKIQGVLT